MTPEEIGEALCDIAGELSCEFFDSGGARLALFAGLRGRDRQYSAGSSLERAYRIGIELRRKGGRSPIVMEHS